MALKLQYRLTFIDVDEGQVAPLRLRSKSLPALTRTGADSVSDAKIEEGQLGNYVATLAQRTEQLGLLFRLNRDSAKSLLFKQDALPEDNKQQSTSTVETDSTASPTSDIRSFGGHRRMSSSATSTTSSAGQKFEASALVPSQGSLGHPEFCRRPCLFFAQNACEKGSDCGFCHIDHSLRSKHVDKRNRELLKKLGFADVVPLVLKLAQERALKTGTLVSASPVLHVLEGWASAVSHGTTSTPAIKRIHTALKGMPLSGLISLVLKTSEEETSVQAHADFKGQLHCALAQMRQ